VFTVGVCRVRVVSVVVFCIVFVVLFVFVYNKAVSFIGGGNWSTPENHPTSHLQTSSHNDVNLALIEI
jgi:hypothetical protein